MSRVILVTDRPDRWPLEIPAVEVVSARAYLTEPGWSAQRRLRVFNLCRSYRYQSWGYYVSLLADARGHRPLPAVATIQALKSPAFTRLASEDLDELIRKSLQPIASDSFTLSVYFGRNLAERHRRLALQLFNLFPAPLLRAEFRRRDGEWQLQGVRALAVKEVPDAHHEFLIEAAVDYFRRRRPAPAKRRNYRYELAMLVDHNEVFAPSDEAALRKIERAGERAAVRVERIVKDDFARLAEFDALLIRQTTAVDHVTYRFARRAAAEGLAVIDDPESILRCSNKVFLAELLARARVPTPRTVVVYAGNVDEALDSVGLPAVLKLPDASFSQGVRRAQSADEFHVQARQFLQRSDLVIAQEYVPTDFDWRVGVLDRQALFAARYRMARGHWQIAQRDGNGKVRYGGVEGVALDAAPPAVVEVAVTAANLIGDGFYGVDVKEADDRVLVIEINDNPNLDAGCEDAAAGDVVYDRLIASLVERVERRRDGGTA